MDFELEQIILERLLAKDLEPTQENIYAEIIIYSEELEAQAEADRQQEVVDRAQAIVDYDAAVFIHVDKLVLDYIDMTSIEINNARLSLEHQEAGVIEQIRFDGMTVRFDALHDLRSCMVHANISIPNSKKMRFEAIRDNNVALLESLEAVNNLVISESEDRVILENRRKEYGSIQDQLDEIFHDMDAWKVRIQSVKDKYPKKS